VDDLVQRLDAMKETLDAVHDKLIPPLYVPPIDWSRMVPLPGSTSPAVVGQQGRKQPAR
jgi:hypothetical protein